jgi:hypothetical protein
MEVPLGASAAVKVCRRAPTNDSSARRMQRSVPRMTQGRHIVAARAADFDRGGRAFGVGGRDFFATGFNQGRSASGRFDPFAAASGNGRYLRIPAISQTRRTKEATALKPHSGPTTTLLSGPLSSSTPTRFAIEGAVFDPGGQDWRASTHTFPKFFHRTQLSDRARDRLPRAVGRQGQPCDSN